MHDAHVGDPDQPRVLAAHLLPMITAAVTRTRGADRRIELVDRLLAVPSEFGADDDRVEGSHRVAGGAPAEIRQLLSLTRPPRPGVTTRPLRRPATALSEAALLTNAKGEPTLAAELRAELESADGVDLLCAFITWQGVRLLGRQLDDLRACGVPVRVITTTYLGATDARALDVLVDDHGAQVKVTYETERTRLHAKAWLLHRDTGFDTAYVGSSNLSHAALVDGLEWNVRLSTVATPSLIDKFRATFETYWASHEFEGYRPDIDGERLRTALDVAGGRRERGTVTVSLSGLEVRPKPHQAEILEALDAERTLHDRHRNLVVAATGTGKTVVAALDYRRLVRETHGRDLSLLFVAHRTEILEQSRRMYAEVLSDATFGELWVGGRTPERGRHVFASVQSLSAAGLGGIEADRFDVVVIDEFHHAQAVSYRRILDHVEPIELLGLTATPERGDGVDVRSFFDGRTAAELRLWDALDQNLLSPFHYFGIHDGTDLSGLTWSRGSYDVGALDGLYTGNDARARIVLSQVRDTIADVGRMKRRPSLMREGVAWCEAVRSDAFLITLAKSERDFSPTTVYRDYALTPELFHWESQSTTSVASATGQRYLHHAERGTHILLFVRATARNGVGTAPYVFLGPADYVSHTGDRPVAITWRMRRPMPTETFVAARAAVAS